MKSFLKHAAVTGVSALVTLLVGLLIAMTMACTPSLLSAQRTAADALGRSVNAAAPVLAAQEENAGLSAIKKAPTVEQALAALQEIEQHWKPVWAAIDALAAAQDAWILVLDSGGVPRGTDLLKAVCDLEKVVGAVAPAVVANLPKIPGFVCP